MLPEELHNSVEAALTTLSRYPVKIKESQPHGGGCINETYALKTNAGHFFLKYNRAALFPGMFEKEAAGLKILGDTNTIFVPGVTTTGATENYAFLLLHFIESGNMPAGFWVTFGTQLAELHRNTALYFGLEHDNYIGSLVQTNKTDTDFYGFYISQRIEPQLAIARNKGAFSRSDTVYFDSLFRQLHNVIPAEKPALIHGDLWSGNYLVSENGSPCLVDPAVYYGHRESDISMTQLFGGFKPEFYQAYNHAWPMEKD